MKVKYCPLCERMVKPTKKFSWMMIIAICVFTLGWGLLIYIPYYFFFKSGECPICGSEGLLDAKEQKALEKINETAIKKLDKK